MTRLDRIHAVTQTAAHVDEAHQQRQQVQGPWLTSIEACEYLRYTGKARLISLYRFLKTNGVATARRGGRLLVARRDLEKAIGARRS